MRFFDALALIKIIKIIAYFTIISLNFISNLISFFYVYINFFLILLNSLFSLIIRTKQIDNAYK